MHGREELVGTGVQGHPDPVALVEEPHDVHEPVSAAPVGDDRHLEAEVLQELHEADEAR